MQFSYKAKTFDGQIKYGKIETRSQADLIKELSSLGLTLISANEEGKRGIKIKLPKFLKRVGLVDKMLFTRYLAVMLKAGLSFGRAFTVLSEQTNNSYFKEVLLSVEGDVQKGKTLAESLEKFPKVFDPLFVNMIKVGETGGNLEEVLGILATQLKKDHDLISKVRGAMMYPAVIICAMFLIGILMMMFVVPTLLNLFKEMEVELPITTQLIVLISDLLQNYAIFVFMGFIAFAALLGWVLKTPKGKKAFDGLVLRLPVIGGISSKVNMARFSRTLSSMIKSGISIVRALEIISDTLGNTYYKESIKRACSEMQKGVNLSEVISRDYKLYQPLMIHMIEVGEETGTLEDSLRQVAEFYEDEVEQITSNLSSIIEPVLMIVIGGAVGFFAVSMIQPMYSIMGSI